MVWRVTELHSTEQDSTELGSTALAHKVADVMSDKKASDIVVLDLRGLTYIADYFVIGNGTTERQIRALADEVEQRLKQDDRIVPYQVEGTSASGWVLIDYGEVIVHIFSPSERDYYKIEKIWSDAPVVVKML